VRVTDDAGCSTSQTFTGQTVSCNGSPAAQTSRQVAISAPTGVGPPAPVLSRLRLRPNAFQAAHNGSVIRAGDVGSEVSYRDTLAAHARLRVYRELPGIRRGKRCVTPPSRRGSRSRQALHAAGADRQLHTRRPRRPKPAAVQRPATRSGARPGTLPAWSNRDTRWPQRPRNQSELPNPGTTSSVSRPRPRRRLRQAGRDLTRGQPCSRRRRIAR
jgi:hypothetical protein